MSNLPNNVIVLDCTVSDTEADRNKYFLDKVSGNYTLKNP
jgi:hypothetical protein